MKLLSYYKEDREQLGVLINGLVYDMEQLHPDLPNSMNLFLNFWDDYFPVVLRSVTASNFVISLSARLSMM